MTDGRVRVLLADDHQMVREGIASVLEDQPAIEIIGQASNGLEALEKLPASTALFVHHKRIPVFLLPELRDRKFDYRIKEIGEGEVHLLIFKIE